jgi:hypothetical protein
MVLFLNLQVNQPGHAMMFPARQIWLVLFVASPIFPMTFECAKLRKVKTLINL